MSDRALRIVDAHQHFWDLERSEYPWLTAETPEIHRTFGFSDVAASLARQSIDGTVLVQAADTDADTDAMFDVAEAHPEIVGVVGYLALERPEAAAARLSELHRRAELAELRGRAGLVGIRNLIHDQPDPDWLLRPDVAEGLALLERARLPFDLVAVLPRHLEHVDYLSTHFPDLDIVIDHLAKPLVKTDQTEPWTTLIRRAADNPRVHAKVSGLYPAVGDQTDHGPDDLRPWVDVALAAFGPERLMIGSDWPVSVLAGGFDAVWSNLVSVISGYGREVSDAVMGRTAVRFYGLEPRIGDQ